MRWPGSLFFSIALLLGTSALALSLPEQKHLYSLRVQCEQQGKGRACLDYGNALISKTHAPFAQAAPYYRRGCDLQYRPACNKRPKVAKQTRYYGSPRRRLAAINKCVEKTLAEFSVSKGTASDGQSRLILTSIKRGTTLSRAGIEKDDALVLLNGDVLSSVESIRTALLKGGEARLSAIHHGTPLYVTLSCP